LKTNRPLYPLTHSAHFFGNLSPFGRLCFNAAELEFSSPFVNWLAY